MPDQVSGDRREIVPGIVVTPDGRIGPGRRDRGEHAWVELARFLGDAARLFGSLLRDPEVSWSAKAVALGAVAYVVSPLDVIPDVIPGLGRLDDLYLTVRALRFLVDRAGYDRLRAHWPGSDDGFALLLVLAGVRR